ncbi:MAG TPA: hypothetical protein VF889_01445 [Bacteroidota bacterium]
MTAWTLFWCIIYGIATVLFFVTAAVITVVGARDLKDLLSRSDRSIEKPEP